MGKVNPERYQKIAQDRVNDIKEEFGRAKEFKIEVPKEPEAAMKNATENLKQFKTLYVLLFIIVFFIFALFKPTLFISGFFGLMVPVAYLLCQDFEVKQVAELPAIYVLAATFLIMPIISILAKDIAVLLSVYFLVLLLVAAHAILFIASGAAPAKKEEKVEKKAEEVKEEAAEEAKDAVKTD